MEFINKIELCGYVGNLITNTVGEKTVVRFSLGVEEAYNSVDGSIMIENTWFNCIACQGEKIEDLDKLEKGSFVHIKGRVRMQRYTTIDGDKQLWEIICKELKVLPKK